MGRVLRVVLTSLLVAAAGVVGAQVGRDRGTPVEVDAGLNAADAPSLASAVARVRRSTVAVETTWTTFDEDGQPGFGRVDGSGFVLEEDGLIVTNAHVVEHAGRVHVLLATGEGVDAEVVGVDAEHDLALLAVHAGPLVPVVIGRSAALQVGDAVAVVGDALGHDLELSTRAGVVAGVGRSAATLEGRNHRGLLELDVDLDDGQSGGPVVDRSGAVVGIATMAGVDGAGPAFAIAIEQAMQVLADLRRGP